VGLESAAAAFDQSFIEWKLEVEASLNSVKLELSKLNSFFARDIKNPKAPQAGVLPSVLVSDLATPGSHTDDPHGHCIDNTYRDCGFGKVYTQTRDPITSTKFPPPPPANISPCTTIAVQIGILLGQTS
jgi:hypothetical protein